MFLYFGWLPFSFSAQKPHRSLEKPLKILETGGSLSQALSQMGRGDEQSVKALNALIEDPKGDMKGRWFGVMALAKTQGHESLSHLTRLANHSQWFIRLASFKALGYLELSQGLAPVDLVVKGLNDPSILVRDGALETLGRWCQKSTQERIVSMLDDPKHFRKKHPLYIRRRAVEILGKCRFDSLALRKRLVRLFDEPNMYRLHEVTHQTLNEITSRKVPYKPGGPMLARQWKSAFSIP